MDCPRCEKQIGTVARPIFVLPDNETIRCRACYKLETGMFPDPEHAQLDPDLCTEQEIKEFFQP